MVVVISGRVMVIGMMLCSVVSVVSCWCMFMGWVIWMMCSGVVVLNMC